MDGHFPPMALYAILALAVAVTAKVTESGIHAGMPIQGRWWLFRVLHLPVLLAWLHLGAVLVRELFVAGPSIDWFGHVGLVVHAAVLGLVGLVCMYTYRFQFHQWRLSSTDL